MEKAKIHLSSKEWKMIRETEWIFVKKQINLKVYELFGALSDELRKTLPLNSNLPEEVRMSEPKISKGDQYKELPYIILDYPRVFNKSGIFAIRTFFLWGKMVSVTLHLSGKYKQQYESAFSQNQPIKHNHYCCFESICPDEWEHEVELPYYVPVADLDPQKWRELVKTSSFLKIAIPFSLDEWNELPILLLDAHQSLYEILVS